MAAYYDLDGQKFVPKPREDEGGGGDPGYECVETREELFEETIISYGPDDYVGLSYTESISYDVAVITFDGIEYICEKQEIEDGFTVYGAYYDGQETFDFSEYPFCLGSEGAPEATSWLVAQTRGEHSIKVEVLIPSVEISDGFKAAVDAAVRRDVQIIKLNASTQTYSPTDIDWHSPVIAYEFDSINGENGEIHNIRLIPTIYAEWSGGGEWYAGTHLDMYGTSDKITKRRYTFYTDGSYTVEETYYGGLSEDSQ